MSDISIQVLPVPTKSEDIEVYRNYALEWKRNGRLEICKEMKAAGMAQKLKQEMAQAVRQFREQTPGCSESMELNFVVKLLFWIDMAAAPVLRAAGGQNLLFWTGEETGKTVFCHAGKKWNCNYPWRDAGTYACRCAQT